MAIFISFKINRKEKIGPFCPGTGTEGQDGKWRWQGWGGLAMSVVPRGSSCHHQRAGTALGFHTLRPVGLGGEKKKKKNKCAQSFLSAPGRRMLKNIRRKTLAVCFQKP